MSDENDEIKRVMLALLAQEEKTARGQYIGADALAKSSGLSEGDLNDAVERLEGEGFLDVERFLGTFPYTFANVGLTARGRAAAKDLKKQINAHKAGQIIKDFNEQNRPPAKAPEGSSVLNLFPTGSPFGFTQEDWEEVQLRRDRIDRISVVFGHQWESKYFDTIRLRENVGKMFQAAIAGLDRSHFPAITLDYGPLQGGYGGHVFNQIARDIISADIAVFDTSDQNPNVMIELGVALTWGIRTLPLVENGAPRLPSDISGLHWAPYQESGDKWMESDDHFKKLQAMVTSVAARKPLQRKYPGLRQ